MSSPADRPLIAARGPSTSRRRRAVVATSAAIASPPRRLVVGRRHARPRAAADRRRRRWARRPAARWIASCGSGCEPTVVEDLGRERAHVGMQAPGRRRGRGPRPAAMVASSPRTCASADRSAPGGCVPWSGWSSCCGSPSRTRFAPRAATSPRRSASDIWPASSTNSDVDQRPRIAGRAPQPRGARRQL